MDIDDLGTAAVGDAFVTALGHREVGKGARLVVVENDLHLPGGAVVMRLHPDDDHLGSEAMKSNHSRLRLDRGTKGSDVPFMTSAPTAFPPESAAAAVLAHLLAEDLGDATRRAAGAVTVDGPARKHVDESMRLLRVPAERRPALASAAVRAANERFLAPAPPAVTAGNG